MTNKCYSWQYHSFISAIKRELVTIPGFCKVQDLPFLTKGIHFLTADAYDGEAFEVDKTGSE